MMTPASLSTKLQANAGLVALVSTRMYPVQAPQGRGVPYIVWTRVANRPLTTMGEASSEAFTLVQFTIFARTFTEAEAISLALVAALDNSPLSTGDSPTLQSNRDGGFDNETSLYTKFVDFLV